MVRHLLRF